MLESTDPDGPVAKLLSKRKHIVSGKHEETLENLKAKGKTNYENPTGAGGAKLPLFIPVPLVHWLKYASVIRA